MSVDEAGKWLALVNQNPLIAIALLFIALKLSTYGRELVKRLSSIEATLTDLVQVHRQMEAEYLAAIQPRYHGRRNYDNPRPPVAPSAP